MNKFKHLLLTLVLAAPLVSAEPSLEEISSSPETFAVCRTVDVATTIYLLEHGLGTEANPIVAWTMQLGGYVPLIVTGVLAYMYLKQFRDREDSRTALRVVNGVTCLAAASNVLLLP